MDAKGFREQGSRGVIKSLKLPGYSYGGDGKDGRRAEQEGHSLHRRTGAEQPRSTHLALGPLFTYQPPEALVSGSGKQHEVSHTAGGQDASFSGTEARTP